MVDMTPLPTARERIDFRDWVFCTGDEDIDGMARKYVADVLLDKEDVGMSNVFEGLIRTAITEAMRATLCDPNPDPFASLNAQFYWQWNYLKPDQCSQQQPAHPMTVYVSLPFDATGGDRQPTWEIGLREMIIEAMDHWSEYDEHGSILVNSSKRPSLEAFVVALETEAAFARKLLEEGRAGDDDGFEMESK